MKTTFRILAVLSLTATLSAQATTIVWTNPASGTWGTAANWSPNAVPGTGDTAVITNAGTYSVTNNGTRTIGGLVVGGNSGAQTLVLSTPYALTLNGGGSIGTNGRVTLNGGLFGGTNTVTVDGQITWNNGNIGTDSQTALLVTTNGQVLLSGTASRTFSGALTNAGRIVWADAAIFNQFGTIHNAASGLIEAQTNAVMNHGAGSLFVNEGTFRKSGGAGNTDLEPPLYNTGLMDAQTGTIRFLNQNKTFGNGSRFTGAGTNSLTAGTITLSGAVESANLLLDGATLIGAATLSGSIAWSSGPIDTGAALTLANGGLLEMIGSSSKTMKGSLTNAGQVVWGGTGRLYLHGLVHNAVGGVFEIRNDTYLDWTTGTPLFINDGTLRKTQSTGNTYVQVALINNGTIDAQTGTLQLLQELKTFNAGSRFTGAGTVALPSGTMCFNGAFSSENLTLQGATLTGNGSLSGTMAWTYGTIATNSSLTVASAGLLNISGTASKTITGALTNAGQILWTDTGYIRSVGRLHNLASGIFEARNDAYMDWTSGSPLFINDGIFRKAQSTGSTVVQIALINNGTIDIQTGTLQLLQETKTFNAGCRFTGAGTTLLPGGTSVLNGTINSDNLVLGGATLSGVGSVNGSFTWNSGTLSPDVSFNVSTNGHLTLASASSKVLNGSITNAGWVTWTGLGNLQVKGAIHNRAGGLFEIQNNEYIDWTSGTPVFVNDGTVRKTVATGTTYCQISFINNGTVDVQTGSLQLLQESKTLNAGCRFTGAGRTVMAGGNITLNGTIESENLSLDGASLLGAGSINGSFTWNSGTLTPDVSFNITSNGLLLLASSSTKVLNGTITNAGVVRWTGTGNLQVRGAIHNRTGGLFDIQNNELLDFVSGSPVVVNEGTFRKSAGVSLSTCQIPFLNAGRVEANSGVLYFSSSFTDQAGTIALGGGTLQTAQPLSISGGQLTGQGTLRPGIGSTALLTSAATVAPATNGPLTIVGGFTQQLSGTLNLELGGTAPGTNHSRLNITGDAAFAGTIGVTLTPGYLPSPGSLHNVLSFKSRSGGFQCFNGFFFFGQNLRLVEVYSNTALALGALSAPDPTNVVPQISASYPTALICWPAEITGWQLLTSTNVDASSWQVVPGTTNRYFDTPMAPTRFFRLQRP